MATRRPWRWRAAYTVPIPPEPSSPSRVYLSRRTWPILADGSCWIELIAPYPDTILNTNMKRSAKMRTFAPTLLLRFVQKGGPLVPRDMGRRRYGSWGFGLFAGI